MTQHLPLTEEGKENLPAITISDAKKKMELALTVAQLNMQAVLNELGSLVLNEDNLVLIKEKLVIVDKIQKKIDEEHKAIKKPYKDGGDACDDAKNELKGLLTPEYTRVNTKYVALCQAKEKREREEAAEEKRKQDIRDGMTANINDFSTKIAAAETAEELVSIEKSIGAEKTKKKYAEFLPEMITKLDALRPLITAQKEAIKTLKGLSEQMDAAVLKGDDEAVMEILDKQEAVTASVQENRVVVQEVAVKQSYGGGSYTTVKSGIKPAKRLWKVAIADPAIAVKHDLNLLRIELNPETAKARLEELKTGGILKEGGLEDHTVNGIRYYLERKF